MCAQPKYFLQIRYSKILHKRTHDFCNGHLFINPIMPCMMVLKCMAHWPKISFKGSVVSFLQVITVEGCKRNRVFVKYRLS